MYHGGTQASGQSLSETRCYCGRLLPRMPRQGCEGGHGRRTDYTRRLTTACGNACGVKLQLRSGANCAEAVRRASFKNSLRWIEMDIAPSADLMSLICPELYSGRRGMS